MFVTKSRPVDRNQPRRDCALAQIVGLLHALRQLVDACEASELLLRRSPAGCGDRQTEVGHQALCLLFSSRSWRNSRNSFRPRPLYFFFQR